MAIGDYPVGYDAAKHGPFDPARYYGTPDTPFGDVKIKDLPSWLERRQKSPSAMMQACSRAFWRWQHKYSQPLRSGISPYLQVAIGGSILFYMLNYPRISGHKHYKYH